MQADSSSYSFRLSEYEIDDDFIQLPELWIDPVSNVDSTAILRSLLRTLWNAFNLEGK